MFNNIPCSVSPLMLDTTTSTTTINNRRRSKSLDDLTATKKKRDQLQQQPGDTRLSCYQDTCTPTSPIVTFNTIKSLPKRRHSLCAEPSNTEYIRLATIYGWIYTSSSSPGITKSNTLHESSSNRHLQTSRSYSHIPCGTSSKFTRMFGRKTLHTATSLTSLFPNKTVASTSSLTTSYTNQTNSKKQDTNEEKELAWLDILSKQQQQHLQHEEESLYPEQEIISSNEPISSPKKPIENDPHVFDLLSKDSSLFIHYGKCDDTTVTSATIEKLVEKLTREMDNDFLMDFFLTFRQFTTPIKLCKLLILRFRWTLLEEQKNEENRLLVRIRTFVVIRHWLTHYWAYDFMLSRTLRFMLSTFLTQLQTHPVILKSPRDARIIKNLRSVFKRQRKFYNNYTKEEEHEDNSNHLMTGLQPTSRKDSAIAIASCRNSLQPYQHQQHVTVDNKWTSKVKRTLKRSISLSTTTVTTANNVVCGCKSNHSSVSSGSNSSSSGSSVHTCCMIHTEQNQASLSSPPLLSTTSRLFLSYRSSPAAPTTTTIIPPYKSLILKYRSEIIAQQFCIIEHNMLQKVTWDELVELRWRKRSSKRKSYIIDLTDTTEGEFNIGVDQLIGFFNMTCQWVASEVVRSHHMETRVKVIEKLIRIALKCYHHRNYSTLMQILLGLQSPAVSRLEKTWQKVDHCQIELFNQLKEMAKPFRNWKNVRDCMTKATEEVAESFAVESVLTNSLKEVDHANGCIPFLGLYLSDLVFVAELPTFIESSTMDTTTDDDEDEEDADDKELCDRLSSHLVNYNKFRITASVVKHVLAFQVLSRAYDFKIHPALYTQLQSMSLLDNSQIRKASFLCEE